MSSWDRSRSIPWSLVRQDASDPDAYKEQVFKSLQKQMMEQTAADEIMQDESQKQQVATRVPYSTEGLLKMGAFGATIGAITGAVFGFMDSMRTAGESTILKNSSQGAQFRYIVQGSTRSATVFGGFFSGFHVLKYGLRVAANPGEWTEIGVAGAISLGALSYKPSFRPSMPYAAMLVIMDGIQIVMRDWDAD